MFNRSIWRALLVLPVALCSVLGACRDDTTAPRRTDDPHAITVAFCAEEAPIWVAFQDGDGAWTRALPDVSGGATTRFTHPFSSNRGAIASVTPVLDGEFTLLRVFYGTPDELPTDGIAGSPDCVGASSKTLHGSVSGLDATDFAQVNVGQFIRSSVVPRFGTDFALEGVPAGPQDLLATRSRTEADGTTSIKFILRRAVDLPNDATIPALDFGSAEAFAAATPNVTIENGLPAFALTELHTSNGQFAIPFDGGQSPAAATRPYFAVPVSKLQPGDVQLLHVSSDGADRTVDIFYHTPVDQTVRFGATPIAPAVSFIGTGPALRLHAHFVPQDEYDRLTSIVYEQPASPAFASLSITPSYASRAGSSDIDVPDLLSLPGFDPAWALSRSRGIIVWTASRVGGTLPLGRNPVPFDGAVRRTNVIQQVMNVP